MKLADGKSTPELSHLLAGVLFFLLYFSLTVLLHWAGGVYRGDFGGSPDEAAHYVTGLMVRDYIAGGIPGSPMAFAQNYYIHYPEVALGHWPPMFYILQALWTLIFPISKISMMVLMDVLTAILGITIFGTVRKELGLVAGFTAGTLFLVLPLVQEQSGMLMGEIPVALFSFVAMICFARYVETEKWRWSGGFALFALLTAMTKGNGLALALLPPITLLLTKRLKLLLKTSFLVPAVAALVLTMAWYIPTLKLVNPGMVYHPGVAYTKAAMVGNSMALVNATGFVLFLVVLLGFSVKIVSPFSRSRVEPIWAASTALIVAVWVFHALVPASLDRRHLITALPPSLMLMMAGATWTTRRFPIAWPMLKKELLICVGLLAIFAVETFAIPRKASYGFDRAALELTSRTDLRDSVFLVSSEGSGEGMFIAEVAMREGRPSHYILRATKVLSTSGWDNQEYHCLYDTPEAVMRYLDSVPVNVLVIDRWPGIRKYDHHNLLLNTIRSFPGSWQLISDYSGPKQAPYGVSVYLRYPLRPRPAGKVSFSFSGTVGMIGAR